MKRAAKILGIVLGVLVLAIVVFLLVFDWNWLRGPIESQVSKATGRPFEIGGDINVDLGLVPHITVNDIRLGNAEWAEQPDMLRLERLEAEIDLLELLSGDIVLPLVALIEPDAVLLRDAQGRANWEFDTGPDEPDEGPPPLPQIRRIYIEDGDIALHDAARKIDLTATLNSANRLDAPAESQFELTGEGSYNGGPFALHAVGGSLLELQEGTGPWPIRTEIRLGQTRATVEGRLDAATGIGSLSADVSLEGPSLGALRRLTTVPLPETPPYRIAGHLTHRGQVIEFTDFSGKVGDSDLAGDAKVDLSAARPRITAELTSDRLDFDDLNTLFGAPPATGPDETASEAQRAQAAALAEDGRLLPDAPLDFPAVRGMDAKVTYRAKDIATPSVPLTKVAVDLTLENGLLTVAPLRFGFPQGQVDGGLRLDARQDVVASAVDLAIRGIDLGKLAAEAGQAGAIEGVLNGRAQFDMRGNTARAAAASADGALTFVMDGGEIRSLFIELIGTDIAESLGLVLSEGAEQYGLRCAVIRFAGEDGVLRTQPFVIDTTDSVITADGTLNLGSEEMNLTIEAHSKDPSLFSGQAPITIDGRLRTPNVGIKPAGPLARGGAAAALGAVINPLLGVVPFIDLGTAEDSNCAALIARAEQRADDAGLATAGDASADTSPAAQDAPAAADAPTTEAGGGQDNTGADGADAEGGQEQELGLPDVPARPGPGTIHSR